MTIAVTTISKAGTFSGITANSIAIKADGVNILRPDVDGIAQVLYGIEQKRNVLGRYYKKTRVESPHIRNVANKGILFPGDFGIVTGSKDEPAEIHNCGQDGVFLGPGNYGKVEWANIHHLGDARFISGSALPHADGVQITGGTGHVITQSWFDLPHTPQQGFYSNSCIYIESDFGPIGKVTINSCELYGGLYSLFIQATGKYGPPQLVEVFNTKFKGGTYYRPDQHPGWTNWKLDKLPSWLHIDKSSCTFEDT